MSINHDSYVNFYALVGSAQCWGIKILTIGDFNSFGFFWDTLHRKTTL